MIKGLNGMHRILKLLSATSNFLFKGRRDSEEVGSKDVRYIKILINKKNTTTAFCLMLQINIQTASKLYGIMVSNSSSIIVFVVIVIVFFAIKIHKDHKKTLFNILMFVCPLQQPVL